MVGPRVNGMSEVILQLFLLELLEGEVVTLLFEEHVVGSKALASGFRNQGATEAHCNKHMLKAKL